MRSFVLSLAAGLVGASSALAQPCALQDLQPLPALEQAKEHFLNGRYRDFADLLVPMIRIDDSKFTEVFRSLSTVAPNGYDSCTTVARRTDAGGMVQELTLFTGLNKSGRDDQVLSLYVLAVQRGDDHQIALFSIKDTIGAALDELK